jgi:hypothetical protein
MIKRGQSNVDHCSGVEVRLLSLLTLETGLEDEEGR